MNRGISMGAIVIVVVVVVIIGAGAGYYFLSGSPGTSPSLSVSKISTITSTSSSTTSVISTSSVNTSQVSAQITIFVNDFNKRDVQGVSLFYTPTSLVVWSGVTQGLGGTYSGLNNIRILYGSSVGYTTKLGLSVSNVKVGIVAPNTVNATFDAAMTGTSNVVGNLNASAKVQQQWVFQGGSWSIQKENWNYLSFAVQNAGEATVFPQWGLQLSGHSPDLARMHTIEWNAGPYLAAGIYVLLIVVAASVMRTRFRI